MFIRYIPFYVEYFILCILLLLTVYIILTAYLRIKMPFWQTQPVFHIYNLSYWLKPPGIINKTPPSLNKFVNLGNNKMIQVDISGASISNASISNASISNASISNASISNASTICKFISDYYIIHDSALYKPSEQDIMAYLECCNQPSFFNIYQDSPIAFGSPDREMIGAISARVLNVTLTEKNKPIHFPVYYIDNLCVKPGYRKKGIAPEMIQTLYYTISRANPKVNAYLFKREGQLNAIVPLVYYDSYAFDLTFFRPDSLLTGAMTILEIGISQLNLFMAFVKSQLPKFDCIVLPDVSNVLNLIKLGKIKIYGILFQGELIAVYIFRCLELYYEEKKAVECIAILSNCETDVLNAGFALSWLKINALTGCEIVIIEETAHSKAVIKALGTNSTVSLNFKSPTAFFLYNYAAYSAPSAKALLFY